MKLEAWHLLGLGLLYFGIRNENTANDKDITSKFCTFDVPQRLTQIMTYLPALAILIRSADNIPLEHTLMLVSFVLGIKGLTMLTSSTMEKDYYIALVTCLLLSSVYHNVIPRKNYILAYTYLLTFLWLRLCEEGSSSGVALQDIITAHLAFSFTK